MLIITSIGQPHQLWIYIGGFLLVIEILINSGCLLWSGIAALTVGIICWILPLPWIAQGILFIMLTLFIVLLSYRWVIYQQCRRPSSTLILNQRALQMRGMQLTLTGDLVNGIGNVRIGDSSWRVQADIEIPAGTRVKIVEIEGITLRIYPYRKNSINH